MDPTLADDAAAHFAAKLRFETDPADLAADLAAGTPDLVVVDTRAPEAFAAGHIPGAINLPHRTIAGLSDDAIPTHQRYVAYCWGPACNASTKGALALALRGRNVRELIGGLSAWQAEGFEVHGHAPDATEADLAPSVAQAAASDDAPGPVCGC